MVAPVCGCSTMSLRSVVLKRPLRARSELTSCATSKGAGAAPGEPNGTIAIGMASACPFVISTTSWAHVREQNNRKPIASKEENRLFIGFEPKYEVSLKERRIRGIRQGGCTIHRVFDRLAGGRIAIALGDAGARHFAAGNLGDFDQAIKADACRRRLDPCILNSITQFGDIAVAQGTGCHRVAALLVRQVLAQLGLAILAGTLVGRTLGVGDLLGFRSLLLSGLLGLGSFSRRGVGVGSFFGLRGLSRRGVCF